MKYIRSYQYHIYIYIIKNSAESSLYSFDIKLSTQYFSTCKH